MWGAVAASPSVSPPATSLSLNTRLQLLAASGGPFLPGLPVGSPFHPGGGYYGNVAASPTSSFSATASPFPLLPPLDAGPALEHEMCLGPSPSAAAPVERRKKRMIKNRESASRSRARKHAHVTQIETEVIKVREANEQLRQKYEQVSVPVKKTLQRVLSAPF